MNFRTLTNKTNQKGFTLIELLVVIGILAILLAITLIAINPAHQFAQANNTKRRSDILQVLNAIGQYAAENKGQLPPEILTFKTAADYANKPLDAATFPNLCGLLVPTYIPALPKDPTVTGNDVDAAACAVNPPTWTTGYQVAVDAQGRITVTAPSADENAIITVTR